jgi:hypothetical protein
MFLPALLFFNFLAIWWLRAFTKNDANTLTTTQITIAFLFKVVMGCAYGYIFLVNYDGDDTWFLHEYSLGQQDLLINDPWWFLAEMNPVDAFTRADGFSQNFYYYLAYLEAWLLGKPFAFLNFLSGGNYYINIVFFNIPVFIGQYWLYKLLKDRFSVATLPLFIAVFLVPPIAFWLSGLRADGILFFLIMLAGKVFIELQTRVTAKRIAIFLLALTGIAIFRSMMLFLLIPAFTAWHLSLKRSLEPIICFAGVYAVCILGFIGSTIVSPGRNAASVIVSRQEQFLALEGNTRFALDTLRPTAVSFIKVLPQAVNNTFLRPYPWEAKGALQYATVMEVLLFIVLLVVVVLRPVPGWRIILRNPFILTLLFTAFFLYLLTGYTVPFPGAIVRYKIIGEIFFLVVIVICTDWQRIFGGNIK